MTTYDRIRDLFKQLWRQYPTTAEEASQDSRFATCRKMMESIDAYLLNGLRTDKDLINMLLDILACALDEREQMMIDLRDHTYCDLCAHNGQYEDKCEVADFNCYICQDTEGGCCPCGTCDAHNSNWAWRGMPEKEDTHE